MNPNILYAAGAVIALYAFVDAYKDKLLALIPKKAAPVAPPIEKDLPSVRYIQVQNCLLDVKELAHDCPEALAAIDAAIKATVAMVVKGGASGSIASAKNFVSVSDVVKELQTTVEVKR